MPRRNNRGRGRQHKVGHRPSRKEDQKAFESKQSRLDNESDSSSSQNTGQHSAKKKSGHGFYGSQSKPEKRIEPTSAFSQRFSNRFRPLKDKDEDDTYESPLHRAQSAEFVEGRIELHPDGFGFLIPKDPKFPNIYVGEGSLKNAMHRDIVRVRITQRHERDTKLRGEIVEILSRSQKEFIGIYRPYSGGALVIPSDPRDRKHAFKVRTQETQGEEIKSGSAVLCKILEHPSRLAGEVEIVEGFKDPTAASLDTLRSLVESNWPREHTRHATEEAEKAAQNWQQRLEKNRVDLRSKALVTIDGRDARDFDDAVYAEIEGKNIRLWVAIADVSFFVETGSKLDQEAYARSTSVYFPDYVVPMLPEVLSNGVCSLNPFEDRACMVAEMVISPQGKIIESEIYNGLMQSHRRLTYEQMQAFIEGETWALQDLKAVKPSLEALTQVFHRLNEARMRRGAIDLDIPEALVVLNQDGTVRDFQSRARLDAHRLIEECMLIANECVAKFLREEIKEAVYRVHEKPDPKKVQTLRDFIELSGALNISVPSKKKKKKGNKAPSTELENAEDFAALLEHIRDELGPLDPKARAIQTLTLRSLKQARYSSEPLGHFALASKDYTHFTSPIRRYPDLMVHRLLKMVLHAKGNFKPSQIFPCGHVPLKLEDATRHCSDQERVAIECERRVIETKKCRFLEPHVGEIFEAWVTNLSEKGVFAQLDKFFVDGFISAEILHKRLRAVFDDESLAYVGSGLRLELGTRIQIEVISVTIDNRRIDFDILEVN